jgi:hypothetical protein
MDPILQEALAGAPVEVTLGGKTYPLAFPIQAVILYKSETARLDRERNRASGVPALTREAKREMRARRRTLAEEAEALRPAAGAKWDDEKFVHFDELFAEGIEIKATIDADAAAGDSLYDKSNWWKISPEGDPERMMLALWVGLHEFVKTDKAKPKFTARLDREELGGLINLGNGEALTRSIAEALRAHLVAPAEDLDEEEASPNAEPPAPPATGTLTLKK